MNRLDIVRAWKDEQYRASLTEAQRAALPQNPVGIAEVPATDLEGVAGGAHFGGQHTQSRVCRAIPKRSLVVQACPRTYPIACPITVRNCPQLTILPTCPRATAVVCPPVSLACPQGGPGPAQF